MATRISEEGLRARPSKALRADIRAERQQVEATRRAAAALLAKTKAEQRAAERAAGAKWQTETEQERRDRIDLTKRTRGRKAAKRRADPDQAFVDDRVSREAQQHGDYVKHTVPGPAIVVNGEDRPTVWEVVKNRGGTAIERWHTRGDLDLTQIEAIAVYQRAWRLFYGGEQRVTAKWSLVASVRGGTASLESFVASALQAKALLRHFDDAIFFAVPLRYYEIWRNVVIFDEPSGTAGARLGYTNKQAEAAAKAIIILLADMIATDQRLGKPPLTSRAP